MSAGNSSARVWFFGAAVVRSRHYRAHPSCNTALDQAVRRKWDEERAAKAGHRGEGRIQGASTKGLRTVRTRFSGPFRVAMKRGLLTARVDFGQPKSQHGAESWIIRRLTNRRAGTGLHDGQQELTDYCPFQGRARQTLEDCACSIADDAGSMRELRQDARPSEGVSASQPCSRPRGRACSGHGSH